MIGTQSDKVSRVNSDVKMNSHYSTVSPAGKLEKWEQSESLHIRQW